MDVDEADSIGRNWGCVIVLVVAILSFTAYQIASLYVEAKPKQTQQTNDVAK